MFVHWFVWCVAVFVCVCIVLMICLRICVCRCLIFACFIMRVLCLCCIFDVRDYYLVINVYNVLVFLFCRCVCWCVCVAYLWGDCVFCVIFDCVCVCCVYDCCYCVVLSMFYVFFTVHIFLLRVFWKNI